MDKIASGTFEGPNVKTGRAGRDARQHRRCLAFGTRWSLNGHEARLNPAGARYSQSPMDADGGGDGPSWTREVCCPWSILTTTKLRSAIPNVIFHRSIHFSLDDCQTKPAECKPEFAKTAYGATRHTLSIETTQVCARPRAGF